MTPVDDLAGWLTQVWDEQEKVAKAATPGPWKWQDPGPPNKMALLGDNGRLMIVPSRTPDVYPSVYDADFMEANDPASALARIAADRKILAEFVARDKDVDLMLGPDCLRQREWSGLRLALRIKAAQYRSRPGFNPDWLVESDRAHP